MIFISNVVTSVASHDEFTKFRWVRRAGIGNLVTGLLGAGYTGSYIFSQTLFAMRAGVHTRLHGWLIAVLEIGMFLLPFSVRRSSLHNIKNETEISSSTPGSPMRPLCAFWNRQMS